MNTSARFQRGHALPSFEGEAQAFPDQERSGEATALAIAIAEASHAAADWLAQHDLGTMSFEVSKISVVVEPNPGPKTYRAVISPGG